MQRTASGVFFSEITHSGTAHLQLELVRNQGDELRIGRLALGIGNRVPKESLQGIQIATIPCNLNGVTDRSFHSRRRGLECFRHLRVQYLRNGISLPGGKQGVNSGKSMV